MAPGISSSYYYYYYTEAINDSNAAEGPELVMETGET